MAYCKVSTTKNAVAALRYGEHEKEALVSGKDCPDDTRTAEHLFRADRIQWNKENGVQAHIVIQSFKPGECSKEEAHQIGVELAEKMFPGRRAMIFTHDENGIPHNHIVAENVSYKDGSKLSTSGLLNKSRALSNEITLEHGLSVIDRKHSRQNERHTMAERALIEKGEKPWKQEMRDKVQEAFFAAYDIDSFKAALKERGIDVLERNRTYQDKKKELDFTFADRDGHKCRAHRLGDMYTRREISKEYKAQAKEREQERTSEFSKPAAIYKPSEEEKIGIEILRGMAAGKDIKDIINDFTAKQLAEGGERAQDRIMMATKQISGGKLCLPIPAEFVTPKGGLDISKIKADPKGFKKSIANLQAKRDGEMVGGMVAALVPIPGLKSIVQKAVSEVATSVLKTSYQQSQGSAPSGGQGQKTIKDAVTGQKDSHAQLVATAAKSSEPDDWFWLNDLAKDDKREEAARKRMY